MVPAVVVEIVPVLVVEMVPVFVVEIVPVFERAVNDRVMVNNAEHAMHLKLFIGLPPRAKKIGSPPVRCRLPDCLGRP
jgi:hypothetical protein